MRRLFTIIMATAAAAALALSCTKEKENTENTELAEAEVETPEVVIPEGATVFTASAEEAVSKTTIENGAGSQCIVKWAKDDEITIWWDVDKSATAKAASAGSSTSFVATVDDADNYYAVYPAAAATEFKFGEDSSKPDSLFITVPAVQDGTFSSANIAVAKSAAADKNFAFLNATALVKFQVSGSGYTKAIFRGAKGEVLAGKLPVTFNGNALEYGKIENAAKAVEVPLSGAGEYYIAVLPTALSGGFSISLLKDEVVSPAAYRTVSYELDRASLLNLDRVDDKIISTYYASPEGAGNKDGKSEANAFGLDELRAFLAQPLDAEGNQIDGEAAFKASILDGVTIHFADGTYVLPDAEHPKGFKLEFTGYPKQVSLTLEGGKDAILSGNGQYRIMVLGNQVSLAIKGMTVKDGSSETIDENGGGIFVAAGASGNASLSCNGTAFSNNKAPDSRSGGAIRCSKGSVSLTDCSFDAQNYARNGGSIFTDKANAKVSCTDCTFKSHTYNTGGAVNNSAGEQSYKNCIFDGCYTLEGNGGAVHANAAGATVTLEGCQFLSCKARTNAPMSTSTSKGAGIISVQQAEVTIDNCLFSDCEAATGALIYLQAGNGSTAGTGGWLKCNNTRFIGNRAADRGLIQTAGGKGNKQGPIGFFNNCLFKGNTMRTNQWGFILHGGNPGVACFNNCTIYGNERQQAGGNGVMLNTDGFIVFTNSTLIGSADLVSVRANDASNNARVLLANSIIINTSSVTSPKVIGGSNTTKAPLYSYSNIMGPVVDVDGVTVTSEDDYTTATLSTLEALGGSFNDSNYAYTWDCPAANQTMTAGSFETLVKSSLDVKLNNFNAYIGDKSLGELYYGWLEEIGAIGKDALGTARGSAWWPGAYQGN